MFTSGLSTKKEARIYSGRGVGMEVLMQSVDQLECIVCVNSHLGLDTKLELVFPLDTDVIFAT